MILTKFIMKRPVGFFFFSIAGIIGYLTVQFFNNYHIVVQEPNVNLITRVGYWSIIGIAILAILVLVFFQEWIYINRKKLFLSLATFFLGIIAIELFLRIGDNRPLRFAPHPYINYIGAPNYKSIDGLNMHNSLGMRGPEIEMPKPKGRIRIAILGGSTVYEDYVKDWKKDFARQLQGDLKQVYSDKDIEVINAGLSGWSSWNDLTNLEFRLIDLEPDLFIIYEGVNDVHPRLVTPSAYRSDNTGSIKAWVKDSCINILCPKIVQLLTQHYQQYFDVVASTYPNTPPEETGYNSILGMTRMEALKKNPPIYFERNLRSMIAISQEFGIHIMLTTWAWSDQFHDLASTDHYQKGFRENNEVIKKVATTKHMPIYDFASQMPMDKQYWVEGVHNNEEGVALKAKLFADYIVQNKIIENLEKDKK